MAAPSASRRGAGSRSGSTSGVQILGLKELRTELRKLENPRQWTTALGKVQRDIAKQVAEWSRSTAAGMGGPASHAPFTKAIVGRGTVTGARIQINNPDAYAAFWGAKQRSGWNVGNSTPNLPRWVGNSWDVGVAGQGPYAINDTIADRMDDIVRAYREGIDELTAEAFGD